MTKKQTLFIVSVFLLLVVVPLIHAAPLAPVAPVAACDPVTNKPCGVDTFCSPDQSICVARFADGLPCGSDRMCQNNVCLKGVCVPVQPAPAPAPAPVPIAPAVLASTVTRSFSSPTVAPGAEVGVKLAVSEVGIEGSYIIEETVPVGWTIVDAGGLTQEGNQLSMVLVEGLDLAKVQNTIYIYKVSAPQKLGIYPFSGTYLFENMLAGSVPIAGDTQVAVQAQLAPVPAPVPPVPVPVVVAGGLKQVCRVDGRCDVGLSCQNAVCLPPPAPVPAPGAEVVGANLLIGAVCGPAVDCGEGLACQTLDPFGSHCMPLECANAENALLQLPNCLANNVCDGGLRCVEGKCISDASIKSLLISCKGTTAFCAYKLMFTGQRCGIAEGDCTSDNVPAEPNKYCAQNLACSGTNAALDASIKLCVAPPVPEPVPGACANDAECPDVQLCVAQQCTDVTNRGLGQACKENSNCDVNVGLTCIPKENLLDKVCDAHQSDGGVCDDSLDCQSNLCDKGGHCVAPPAPGAGVQCRTAADNNPCDGRIEMIEIAAYVQRWIHGDNAIEMIDVATAVAQWIRQE